MCGSSCCPPRPLETASSVGDQPDGCARLVGRPTSSLSPDGLPSETASVETDGDCCRGTTPRAEDAAATAKAAPDGCTSGCCLEDGPSSEIDSSVELDPAGLPDTLPPVLGNACVDSCCDDTQQDPQQDTCSVKADDCTGEDDAVDDDDTLCPCCVTVVLLKTSTVERTLSGATPKLPSPPVSYNTSPRKPDSSDALERLLGRMRRCCRMLESVCAGKACCFLPEPSLPRQPSAPAKLSSCMQKEDKSSTVKAEPVPVPSATFGTQPLTLEITGMDCIDCLPKINRALVRLTSVKPVELDYLTGLSTLRYDPELISPPAIARYVARATGFGVKPIELAAGSCSKMTLPVRFERVPPLEVLDGLGARRRPELGGFYELSFDSQRDRARQPRDVLSDLNPYGPSLVPAGSLATLQDRVAQDFRRIGLRTLAAFTLTVPVLVFAWATLPPHPLAYGVASVVLTTGIQLIGFPMVSNSVRSIVYLHQTDIDVLVAVSTLTAYAAGKPFTEPFFETTALLISLIYLGRLVQAGTRKATLSAVRALQQLQSTEVILLEQASDKAIRERLIDSRLLHYGDILRVQPDTRLPTDGVVVAGSGEVDESTATGESLPALKQVGSVVIAGTLNLNGTLDVQITQLVHENSLARITGLVRQAQSSRSRFQDAADRFSAVILPIAAASAAISFLVWMLVGRFGRDMTSSASAVDALTYALSILIISCPCAIGLAVPLVVASTMRVGLREGVLFRSSEALQQAHSIDTVAFDKTGTLSRGVFTVERSNLLFPGAHRIVLPLVASNKHPVSKAVTTVLLSAASSADGPTPAELKDIVSLPGQGIQATYASYPLLGGSPAFTSTTAHPLIAALLSQGLTLFTVTLGGTLIAAIGLADSPRPEAASLIAAFVKRGKKVILLSGDNQRAVDRFARMVHIPEEDVRAGCSPKDKAEAIQAIQSAGRGGRVAFVGDGTNDGPALAQADLAISIGGTGNGSEVAVAASGVVILGDGEGGNLNLERSVLAILDLATHARQHIILSLAWCGIYFTFALLLTSGAMVKVRIAPQWAGLGELVSVLPVVAIGFALDGRWSLGKRNLGRGRVV